MYDSMKKLLLLSLLVISTSTFADLSAMMKIYNNPQLAPKVPVCKKDTNCNAFVALSKQWQAIPDTYRYSGFDIKKQARQGDGYGLNKGYSFYKERSVEIGEAGTENFYYNDGPTRETLLARGLAVLLYIEDKNGWVKD